MFKKGFAWIALLVSFVFLISACGGAGGKNDVVRIGTQTYTEVKILAEMYKALIEEQTELTVEITPDLAASPVVIQAMKNNEIDLATLYTGEVFNNYFEVNASYDRREVYEAARDGFHEHYGFTWLEPFGFENTYAFALRQEVADQGGFETVSDLAAVAESMKLGVDTTWLERSDIGYPVFVRHYGFEFGETFPMEISLVYEAAANEEVDVVLAYTTDARIKAFNLKTLKDDKQFFPPYDAAAVARNDLLERYPELKDVLGVLSGNISAEEMVELNYAVDVEGKTPREAARSFLAVKGLLSE